MSDEKYQTFGQLCTNKNAVEEYLGRKIPSKSDKMDNVEWLRKSSSDEWCGSALNKCADEIEQLREENAQLKDRLVQVSGLAAVYQSEDFNLRKERDALREENARLLEALAPFVDAGHFKVVTEVGALEEHNQVSIHVKESDLRAAAAAIREGEKNERV